MLVGKAAPPWEATTVSPGGERTREGERGRRDRTTRERRRADAPRRRRLRQLRLISISDRRCYGENKSDEDVMLRIRVMNRVVPDRRCYQNVTFSFVFR
ncbi:hypothetical protein Hanom_Chr14g01311011 [Helianthus anomalus]